MSMLHPTLCRSVSACLNFFLPRLCVVCGATGGMFCAEHRGALRRVMSPLCEKCGLPELSLVMSADGVRVCGVCHHDSPDYDRHRSLYYFNPLMKDLIHRFKYGAEFWVRHVFTQAMEQLAGESPIGAGPRFLMPIPLHVRRLRERGFNQSELLARSWKRHLHQRIRRDVLQRRIETPTQTDLSRAERRANLAGAFCVKNTTHLAGSTVILIDDVHTTGATLSAAARVLKQAGVARVEALTVAAVVLS